MSGASVEQWRHPEMCYITLASYYHSRNREMRGERWWVVKGLGSIISLLLLYGVFNCQVAEDGTYTPFFHYYARFVARTQAYLYSY